MTAGLVEWAVRFTAADGDEWFSERPDEDAARDSVDWHRKHGPAAIRADVVRRVISDWEEA